MPKAETRTRGRKSPRMERREARRPDRKGRRGASQVPRPAASLQAPVPRKHRASVGAPSPLTGWEMLQDPGAIAPRERVRLFEIVDEAIADLAPRMKD